VLDVKRREVVMLVVENEELVVEELVVEELVEELVVVEVGDVELDFFEEEGARLF
jgi:hypothetical protein